LLDRIEIGAVRRQVDERCTMALDRLAHAGDWLLRLSIMTMSPGCSVGARICST